MTSATVIRNIVRAAAFMWSAVIVIIPGYAIAQGTHSPSLTLTCTPSTVTPPQTAVCTAKLNPAATGSVSMGVSSLDTKAIQPDWTGTATYPDAFVSAGAGTYTFSANYPGDNYFAAASASAVVVVHTGNTTPAMTMTCSPTGTTVAPAACGVQLPTGSTGYVAFTNGSFLSFAPINASGQAIISTEFVGQPHGTYTISAGYGGDTVYGTASATAPVVVNGGTPTSESLASQVSVTCTPSSVVAPQTATCAAQVPAGAQGTVTFNYPLVSATTPAGSISTTIPVDGIGYARAYNVLLGTSAGSYTITASYSGDSAYAASSASTSVTVVQAGTNPGTVVTNNPPVIAMGCDTPINPTGSSGCTAWVSAGATGYITFRSASTGRTIAVPIDASGYASAPNQVSNAAPGVYSVVAAYGGDQTYVGYWTFVGVTVANSGKTTSTLNLSCTPASVASSGTLTCTAQLPAGATGAVNIRLDGASLGEPTIDSQGKATLSTTITASAGTHLITALYGGDSNYTGADDAFQIVVTTAGGGTANCGTGTSIYCYSITDAHGNSGYAPNSNVTSYYDSVMGQWTAGYDNLNRLQSASVVGGPYDGMSLSWSIDAFGNRMTQIPSGHIPPGPQRALSFNNAPNNHADQFAYDNAGNVYNDGSNQYLYDGENRICAVSSFGVLTGYLYDADGRRAAKGTLTNFTCDMTANGFVKTETYLLGQNGEQLVALDGSGNVKRLNVFANGALLGTYAANADGFQYTFADWLGTKRVVYSLSPSAAVAETCSSLPYGDSLVCTGADATDHHFTGKERDTESGNDYFEARYYTSSIGRFISPDPGPYLVPNPQSWNRYTYVQNNPLTNTDPTGRILQIGGESAQDFIDFLKKKSGLNLVQDKRGHLKVEGGRNKDGTNGELAKQINRAISSDKLISITANQGETPSYNFFDDHETQTVDMSDFAKTDAQASDLATVLADHVMSEYTDLAEGRDFSDAHNQALKSEGKAMSEITGHREGPARHIDDMNPVLKFVYSTVQYNLLVRVGPNGTTDVDTVTKVPIEGNKQP